MSGPDENVVGQTLNGDSGTVLIRQRAGIELEMGELLACTVRDRLVVLQVCETKTGSQLAERAQEMIAGNMLGNDPAGMRFYEPDSPNYEMVAAKPLVAITGGKRGNPKKVVPAFTMVRRIRPGDLSFMEGPGAGRLCLGKVRSGSSVLPGDGLWLDAAGTVSHHILIVASTGRGKSNLVKCVLWGLLDTGGVGMLVLDPHGEYYRALLPHRGSRSGLACYTSSRKPAPGSILLKIHAGSVRPSHIRGVINITEAQDQAMTSLHREHGRRWIERLAEHLTEDAENGNAREATTRAVLYRKVKHALGIGRSDGAFTSDEGAGETTVRDIIGRLDAGQVVVVDTSGLGEEEESTIGNMLVGDIMYGRRKAKNDDRLGGLPPVGVVVEEAPRLLSEAGAGNAYSQIAREGRKFKVGLVAVTQLASVFPREVLVNLSTKIIFGNEMYDERKAIIASAAQDLSEDSRNIASLDPGEAIVSSVIAPFAVPIRVPLFDDLVKEAAKHRKKIREIG